MADLTVKQKQIFDNYKRLHPEMKDAEIIFTLINIGEIQLSEEQKLSLFNNPAIDNSGMGFELEHLAELKTNLQETVFLQSGRKIVITKIQDGKEVYKYYDLDGTQLSPNVFKQKEGTIRVNPNRKTYIVIKNGKCIIKKVKDPLSIRIDQQQAELNKIKKEQGFMGKSWDWLKNNVFKFCDSSEKVQRQIEAERNIVKQIQNGKINKKDFKEVTGVEYTKENLQRFKSGELALKSTEKLKAYQEGQEMATDVIADMAAGIASYGIYTAAVAAAPFTGGTSVFVGIAAAAAAGAAIKSGLKYIDAKSGDREYKGKEFAKDILTGGLSGVLAPFTAGLGGAVGKTAAVKFGTQTFVQVGKQVSKEAGQEMAQQSGKQLLNGSFKQTFKTLLSKPAALTFEGGAKKGRIVAWVAEASTAGAAWGGIEGGVRTTYDQVESGEGIDVGQVALSMAEGTIGGAVAGIGFGGAFKGIGKLFGKFKGGKGSKLDNTVETATTNEATPTLPKENLTTAEGQAAKSAMENVQQLNVKYKTLIENDTRLSEEVKSALLKEADSNIIQKRMELCEALKYEFRISEEKYNSLIKDLPIETVEEKLKLYKLVKKNPEFEDYLEKIFTEKNCRTLEDLKSIKKADIELKLKQENELKQAELLKQKQELEWQAKVQESYNKIEQTFGKTKKEVLEEFSSFGIAYAEKIVNTMGECIDKAKSLGKKPDFTRFCELCLLQNKSGHKINFQEMEILFNENLNITKFLNSFRTGAKMMLDDDNTVLENKLKLFLNILECKEPPILENDRIWNSTASKNIFSFLGQDCTDLRLNLLKLACKENKHTDFILNCIEKVNSEEMYNVIDKILKIEPLLKDEFGMYRICEVFNTENFNSEKVNIFLDYILQNKDFAESEMLSQNASAILHTIASQNEYLPILEKVIHNKEVYGNKAVIDHFNGLISSVYYQLDQKVLAKNKLAMLNYLLEEPKLLKNKELLNKYMRSIEFVGEEYTETDAQIYFLKQIFSNKYNESKYAEKFYNSFSSINSMEDAQNFLSAIKIISTDKFPEELAEKIMIFSSNKNVLEFIKFVAENEKLINDKAFIDEYFGDIIGNLAVKSGLNFENTMRIINNPDLFTRENLLLCKNIGRNGHVSQNETVQNAIFKWIENKNISRDLIKELAKNLDENSVKFIEKYIDNPKFEPKTALQSILETFSHLNFSNDLTYKEMAEILCENQTFPKDLIAEIIQYSNKHNREFLLKLANDKNFGKENMPRLSYLTQNSTNVIHSLEDLNNRIALIEKLAFDKELDFPQNGIASFVESRLIENAADPKLLNTQYMRCFKEIAEKNGTPTDMTLAAVFFEFYGKSTYQELSRTQKREFLYKLLEQKNNIASEENSGILPLIPKNEKEYANIIKTITNDLNINTKPLSASETEVFTKELNNLISSGVERTKIKETCEKLSKFMPEIFAKGEAVISEDLIVTLEKVMRNKSFEKLSDKDKQVLLLSALLQTKRNGYTATDKAFDAYYISKKFNLSESDANRIYAIVESSDLIQQFMSASKKKSIIDGFRQGQLIEGIEREDLFDLAAFRLQNGNDFELADILYSAKETEGLTRHFDKLLQQRIREIKATNFIMPQTAKSVYESKAKPMTVWREGKQYTINVVKRSEIENFFAFLHTPEAGFASGGGRTANIANFDILAGVKNNKVINANYISNDFVNFVAEHGFVLISKNNSQHVISGFDMYSLGKDIPAMLIEYYRDRGIRNAYGKLRYQERIKASNALKDILHPEYTKLVQELKSSVDLINKRYDLPILNAEKALKKKIQQLTGKENPSYQEYKKNMDNPEIKELRKIVDDLKQQKRSALESIPSKKKIEQIDDDYINRLDKVLAMFGEEPMSLDKLAGFDEELAKAYKILLSRDANDLRLSEKALMKTDVIHHNDAILSDVEVGPIYTNNMSTIPVEYLELAKTKPIIFLLANQ